MSSSRPLYPGWGTGKKPFKKAFQVFTLKRVDKQDMTAGDKIVLPEAALKDIKRLRLPFPFMFELRKGKCIHSWDYDTKDLKKQQKPRQFCSALEFSGKDKGHLFLPVWMMQNLRVKSGSFVTLKSVLNVPSGESATLKPEKPAEFFDLIAALGPQEFLENTMKHYSVLSKGERILVMHEGRKYYVKIVETAPKSVISILGDVDLNIEFEGGEDWEPQPVQPQMESVKEPSPPPAQQELEQENNLPEGEQVSSEDSEDAEWGEVEPAGEKVEEKVIDQEDADTRRRRMREAALARYESLMASA